MTYQMEYGDAPEQRFQPQPYQPAGPVYQVSPRKRFMIPSILKTSTAFVLGAATLFSAEMWGPDWLRPSTPMGMYEATVEAKVAEAESRTKAPYQAWAIQVQTQANQTIEQYKLKSQGFMAAYQASVDRAKLYAQMTGNLKSQIIAAQLARVSAEQSGEVVWVNLARTIGAGANAISPGDGDSFYDWAKKTDERLGVEIDRTGSDPKAVTIDGWDTGLPDVATLESQLNDVPSMKLPPLPEPAPAPMR